MQDKSKMVKYNLITRNIFFEWGRTAPEQLSKIADGLDTKIISIFTAAAIIVGVMAALVGKIRFDATLIPFVIALICFTVILVKSLSAFSLHWFYVADNPHILKEAYWILEPEDAKQKYWEYVEEDFDNNYKSVKSKWQALQLTIPLLGLEVASLMLWLLLA
jgi:hypothetical protein